MYEQEKKLEGKKKQDSFQQSCEITEEKISRSTDNNQQYAAEK